MRWPGLAGVIVVLMAASCGTESARTPAPSGNAGDAPMAAPAEAEKGAQAGTNEAKAPEAAGGARPSDQAPGAGAGATDSEKPAQASTANTTTTTTKPSAPASVTASIRPGAADLLVVFGSDGTSVMIKVWGVDGLKITGVATPVAAAAVKSGQSIKVAVQFAEPTTESNLAVSVSGTFGGREQTKVQSFTINPGSPPAKPPPGESTTDKDGRRVKVIKAQ